MPPLCSHSSFPLSFCPAAFGTATLTKAGKSSLWMINARSLCHLEPLQNTALKFTKAQNAGVNYSSTWLVLLKARTAADKVARAAPRVGAVGCSWQNSGRRPFFLESLQHLSLSFVGPLGASTGLLWSNAASSLSWVSGSKSRARRALPGFVFSQNEAGKQSCTVRPTRNEMRRRTVSSLLETSCKQQECISKTTPTVKTNATKYWVFNTPSRWYEHLENRTIKSCKAKTWYDPALLDLVWFWHKNINSTNADS